MPVVFQLSIVLIVLFNKGLIEAIPIGGRRSRVIGYPCINVVDV